jgi:hypothetical protein
MLGLAVLLAPNVGCSYVRNRLNDAKDVFTLTAGVGAGAKARLGPLQAGLIYHNDRVGLRAGELFAGQEEGRSPGEDINLLIAGFDYFWLPGQAEERRKNHGGANLIVPLGNLGHEITYRGPAYWTQIEVTGGALLSGKVGFNPGELIDLILGFCGVDIYSDDIAGRSAPEKIVKPEEKTPPPVVPQAPKKFTCAMHPDYFSNEPSTCTTCGMDLIPVDEPVPKRSPFP